MLIGLGSADQLVPLLQLKERTRRNDNDISYHKLSSNMPAQRSDNWTRQETVALLSIWGEANVQHQLEDGKQRNIHVYRRIAERLQREHGFERTGKECLEKVKRLKELYKKSKDQNNRSGAAPRTFLYYDQLDAILGNRPIEMPRRLLESGVDDAGPLERAEEEEEEEEEQTQDDVDETEENLVTPMRPRADSNTSSSSGSSSRRKRRLTGEDVDVMLKTMLQKQDDERNSWAELQKEVEERHRKWTMELEENRQRWLENMEERKRRWIEAMEEKESHRRKEDREHELNVLKLIMNSK